MELLIGYVNTFLFEMGGGGQIIVLIYKNNNFV